MFEDLQLVGNLADQLISALAVSRRGSTEAVRMHAMLVVGSSHSVFYSTWQKAPPEFKTMLSLFVPVPQRILTFIEMKPNEVTLDVVAAVADYMIAEMEKVTREKFPGREIDWDTGGLKGKGTTVATVTEVL